MINLLPPEDKSRVLFARRNTSLRSWIIATTIGAVGILIIIAVGHVFINQSSKVWQAQVQQSQEQLERQQLTQTQAKVSEMSDSIKLVTQVLSKQVLFSSLLSQVGAAMPPGSSLQTLSINSVEGGIDLTAGALDYNSATQVQINLADPKNKIFETADIVSVACQDTAESAYPCQVTIRALFAKNNTFQYGSER